ncbi:alpha/beta hydrolase [Streptomyces sp. NPDC051576]|uniref:alpha/beta hydrolase n=1 Tax=Streptomyces sp. NPDC051576 TaxID=3155803 RepID=UPI0034398615
MTYPIDPELAGRLEVVSRFSFADHRAARANMARALAHMPPYEPAVALDVYDDVLVADSQIPVRVYRPAEPEGDLPGLLFLHGGGFVLGSVAAADADARRLAAEAGVVVVSVEYRLAPEHRYPAAVEDCYAALVWAAKNAAELGLDSDRLAVFGESAGGGLAAAVTLLARDRGGPPLRFQFLCTPELDDRLATPSMLAYADTPGWNLPAAELSWDHYLGEGVRGGDDVPCYAAPARAEDLSGLPPTYITVCQFDPLRDEGIAYAQRLAQAGVLTELHLHPGTFHGSHQGNDATVTRRMLAEQVEALRAGLGGEASGSRAPASPPTAFPPGGDGSPRSVPPDWAG